MPETQLLRILFLEDDPLDAELAILKLEQDGFACEYQHVATRAEFVDHLEADRYDIVLVDYNLPAFTGLDALEIFNQKELDIPFIIVSGNLGEELAVKTLKSGATDYVLKDRLSRLAPAVRRALEEKEIHRQRRADEKKIQRLLQHQMAANRLSIALGEVHQLEEVYGIIYDYIAELMRVDTFILSFYAAQTQLIRAEYVVIEGQLQSVESYPPLPLNPTGGTQSEVIRTGQPIYLPDYPQATTTTKQSYHIRTDGKIHAAEPNDEFREPTTNSAILVPIKEKGSTIGVMQVQSYELDGYTQDDVDILSALGSVAAIAIQNARLLERSQRQVQKLKTLHNIDVAISASIDIQITLNILLKQVEAQLKTDACSISLLPANTNILEYKAGCGFETQRWSAEPMRLGEGLSGNIVLEREIIHVADLAQHEHVPQFFLDEKFSTYYGIPLISKGRVKGILELFYRSPRQLDQEWLDFLETLATQAAIAIDNASLFDQLQRSNFELSLAYDTTLEGWSKALELRDRETKGHGQRVTEMTLRIARQMGVPEADMVHIRRGALLHDIGKMGIPDHILQKEAPLTAEERQIMLRHIDYAYEWLSPIQFLRKALDIPYCHHEHWDGTGYPRGLQKEQIPLAARIFSVVDTWDTLSHSRPHREARDPEEIANYMHERAGKSFDPHVVEVFLNLLEAGELQA